MNAAPEPNDRGIWLRRARPLLGTLVEVGVLADDQSGIAVPDAAFDAIADVQTRLSRFEPQSDIARFNASPSGARQIVHAHTLAVLQAAQDLRDASNGLFDVSLGSAADGWSLEGDVLTKHHDAAQLDLGGIAKGYAVDCAVQALRARGVSGGWVNAGGDLRAFGASCLALQLRDEKHGGVRTIGRLRDAAFATSHYDARSHSRLFRRDGATAMRHVSVAAAECLWADALTKVVAASGEASHPLLARLGAQAWLH
jgi:FAD:protein FMN transferase